VSPSATAFRIRPAFCILLLFTLCLQEKVYAQDSPFPGRQLSGRVTEQEEGIPDMHIINLTSGDATISNAGGYFSIEVSLRDTLLFSAVQYKRKTLIIRQEHLEAGLLLVPVEPFVNELDEVVLRPYNLSGDLDKDLENLPVEETISSISLGLPNAYAKVKTQTERKLFEATTGSGLIPLNPIINGISGRTKMLKKRLARDRAYEKARRTWLLYPDSLLLKQLIIPDDRLEDFKYFCEVDPAFETLTDNGDQLKLWAFFRRKSEDYRKFNALD
jgi:hypothetical protein